MIFPTIMETIRMTKDLYLLPMHQICLTFQAAKSDPARQRKFEAKLGYFMDLLLLTRLCCPPNQMAIVPATAECYSSMKRERPSQSGGTRHGSRSGTPHKTMMTCSKHKNEPLEGRIGQGERRRMIMHGTISSIWRTNVCVSGGIHRPASF